jgi:hypothetical protein
MVWHSGTAVRSGPVPKKLDQTIQSGLKLDNSYTYMYISKLSDFTKDYYNDYIIYP